MMKYLTTILLSLVLASIVLFLTFIFSKGWQRKRQIDTWNRRVEEFKAADTVRIPR